MINKINFTEWLGVTCSEFIPPLANPYIFNLIFIDLKCYYEQVSIASPGTCIKRVSCLDNL